MQIFILYVTTALIFLALDVVMLKTVLRPFFEKYLGDMLAPDINLTAALAFYLCYIGGILWFASLAALREDMPVNALISGALLGFLAYGTYEFTNLATLRGWHWNMVLIDVSWGAVLTGISAWGGVMITRSLS